MSLIDEEKKIKTHVVVIDGDNHVQTSNKNMSRKLTSQFYHQEIFEVMHFHKLTLYYISLWIVFAR